MIDSLTNKEKIRIDEFLSKGLNPLEIAGDIIVGRNLLAFIQMADIVETYLKEEREMKEKKEGGKKNEMGCT